VIHDLHVAWRFLLKHRAATTATVLTLGIAAGSCTIALGAMDNALWRSIQSPEAGSLVTLLDMYDRGDYEGAVKRLQQINGPRDLDRLDADLSDHAQSWIGAFAGSRRRRRAFVAGAVALEITRALTSREALLTDRLGSHFVNPAALPKLGRLITEQTSPVDDLEHHWVLACLATWQDWDRKARIVEAWNVPQPGWALLLGRPQLIQMSKVQTAVGPGGFLGQALHRFPSEARLLLAQAEGHEVIETRCSARYCNDEMTPAVLDDLRSRAKTEPPPVHNWPAQQLRDIHATAIANLAAFDRLLPMAADFAGLASDYPSVRAEANVHIGYLAIRAARPDAALTPLATSMTSDDPYVRYLSEHFTGRALEALGRRAEAIAAYRRALVIMPNALSTSALLASQLFLSDDAAERNEAHTILEAANAAAPRPTDPWDAYWQGDARLWPVYMDRLRQGLRQ
jgi:tetratricopeptide (TPR) repeat protein